MRKIHGYLLPILLMLLRWYKIKLIQQFISPHSSWEIVYFLNKNTCTTNSHHLWAVIVADAHVYSWDVLYSQYIYLQLQHILIWKTKQLATLICNSHAGYIHKYMCIAKQTQCCKLIKTIVNTHSQSTYLDDNNSVRWLKKYCFIQYQI